MKFMCVCIKFKIVFLFLIVVMILFTTLLRSFTIFFSTFGARASGLIVMKGVMCLCMIF